MSRHHAHLNTAARIVDQYKGDIPLAAWLKDFFRAHKQMGSKDRKVVSELVYDFYRLGHALPAHTPVEERLLLGLFLCSPAHPMLDELKPEWAPLSSLSRENETQLPFVQALGFKTDKLFPATEELSLSVDPSLFSASFLQQPDLFLRLRPGREERVREALRQGGVPFQEVSPGCLALPNGSKVEEWIRLDQDAVVQDLSSQRTGGYLFGERGSAAPMVWDCCAASGGKSIMAFDCCPSLRLTVTDVRSSILHNLEARFHQAGITRYQAFVADLSRPDVTLPRREYDLIIADVPCSGSGTWARTPEQLYFFDPRKIGEYQALQQKIVRTASQKLKRGGRMVYITCSVFRKENEEAAQFARSQLGLRVSSTDLVLGYPQRADTLFVSVWEKENGS